MNEVRQATLRELLANVLIEAMSAAASVHVLREALFGVEPIPLDNGGTGTNQMSMEILAHRTYDVLRNTNDLLAHTGKRL